MKSVFVFGDAILDHDVFVRPVGIVKAENVIAPLMNYDSESYSLGGAGRVAAALSQRSIAAKLFTCYGPMDGGDQFAATAAEVGVSLGTFSHKRRGVSIKKRIWECGPPYRPLMRIDRDAYQPWTGVDSAQLTDIADVSADEVACIVVVSHDKGCCGSVFKHALMEYAGQFKPPVLVDPGKDDELAAYGGPRTIFKLNAKQAQRFAATKMPTLKVFNWETLQPEEVYFDLLQRVERAMCDFEQGGIWLTLGPGGMLFSRRGMEPIRVRHANAEALPVVDTCGAGDAAMAHLARIITVEAFDDVDHMNDLITSSNYAALEACRMWRWQR